MSIERYVLRLYPRAWRQRYEEEVLAMLEDCHGSLLDSVNLFFGALDAHLHPHLGTTGLALYERMKQMLSLLRRSLLTIFCAYIGFILAGAAFQKLTEDDNFKEAAQMHSLVGLSFNLVVIGAFVALLAVIAGGLPIALAVIRSALTQKRYGTLFLLTVPILAFALFLGTTLLLEALDAPANHFAPVWHLFFFRNIFISTLLAGAIVSTGAVCFAVARSEISEKLLRFALLPSILTTLSMALILLATFVWGLSLRGSVPQLFNSNDGMFGTSTSLSWLRIVIAMAITTALAVISLIRGISAHSALPTTAA
jgi:hypothetical protein